ncbi:MAG: rod shape-determining protein MreD [Lepagella sp.]
MDKTLLNNFVVMIVMVLLQVLIFNNIMLFSVAIGYVFIYTIIRLPMSLHTNWLLTFTFLLGLVIDIFSDTAGVNTISCTILAMVKRPVLYAYIARDDSTKNIVPCLSTLGFAVYGKYLFTMSMIYTLLTFVLEYFNFADFKEIALMTICSSLFTFILILGIDSLIITRREKRL